MDESLVPQRRRCPELADLVVFTIKQVFFPLLVVPLVAVIVFAYLVRSADPEQLDVFMETLSPRVLQAALAVALFRVVTRHTTFFVWLAALVGTLLCREYHFVGTSTGAYVALGLLGFLAWRLYPAMAAYLGTRRVATLLTLTFFSYFLAQTLDQQWWRFAIGKPDWSSPAEEFAELIGHWSLLLLTILSTRTTESPAIMPGMPDNTTVDSD